MEGQGTGDRYERVGVEWHAFPDSVYPFPADLVARIQREFDPDFRLLWVNQEWRNELGRLYRTGHHVVCRHVPHPRFEADVAKNVLWPTAGKIYHPLVICHTLDGLTQDQRVSGKFLPHYEPFGETAYLNMRYGMWMKRNGRIETAGEDMAVAEKADRKAAKRRVQDEALARKKDRHYQFKWALDQGQTILLGRGAKAANEGLLEATA